MAQAEARIEMSKVDMLLVPTALYHYTVQEIAEEEHHADKVQPLRCINVVSAPLHGTRLLNV